MTAIMSFSNPPDAGTLGLVAGALAVDEAFVEKDWYVVQAIQALVALGSPEIVPIFSGGTSLLKGHGLIKRFSEDIDFKLGLSPAFLELSGNQRRKVLGIFKDSLVAGWQAAGFTDLAIEARDANGFLKIEMSYPTVLEGHDALRPHILAELSAKLPRLATMDKPLTSYVGQYQRRPPEVASIPCVDPVETAADKLSAFTWRMLVRDRTSPADDPTIVRHLHDLAALEPAATSAHAFPALLLDTLLADSNRGGGAVAHLTPRDRLGAMLKRLGADEAYAGEYTRFVEGMAFAGAGEILSYRDAHDAVWRLAALLP